MKFQYISKMEKIEQNFIVDRLTDSIVNTISGDSFQTEISTLKREDLKQLLKKEGWNFNWNKEFVDLQKEVYKLTLPNNANIIQGIVSLTIKENYVLMNLLENAPFNIGKKKLYEGFAGNLVAHACKVSF